MVVLDDLHSGTGQCKNDPCKNGGTCKDADADYSCDCQNGWTGKNCEIGKMVLKE